MPDLAPDAIAHQSFRTVMRGYDPSEVRGFLRGISEGLAALVEERDRLRAKLGLGDPDDLRREIEQVSKEIEAVLEAGRAASEAMRERASAEAARWRSEAIGEAERTRRSAEADAEQLRSDAWTTAEALLVETQREIEHMKVQAEKESMRLVGEAERESHRMLGAGRREAEDAVRTARMQAEKLVLDAKAEHDEIIESARKEAEVAQERTRALEERRDELRRELDSVRAALSSVETELDERRGALGLTPSPATPEEAPTETSEWHPGETVRVVRPGQAQIRGEGEPVSSDPRVAPEATPELKVLSPAELRTRRQPDETTAAADEPRDDAPMEVFDPPAASGPEHRSAPVDVVDDGPAAFTTAIEAEEVDPAPAERADVIDSPSTIRMVEAPVEPDSGAEPAAADEEPVEDAPEEAPEPTPLEDVDGLFARLREPTPPAAVDEPEPAVEQVRTTRLVPEVDPFDVRERLLLPITNRALRNLKRQLTDQQNVVLEEIRLDPADWMPDLDAIRLAIRADLVVLAAEGFAAGHTAAETLVGERLTRPPTPKVDLATDLSASMVEDIEKALDDGRTRDHGARQLGADISRVFRAWRTDETERRIRDLSIEAFNRGVAESLRAGGIDDLRWSVSGRGCARCRERSAEGLVTETSPVHDGCSCIVVPA